MAKSAMGLLRAPGSGLLAFTTGSAMAASFQKRHFRAKQLDSWATAMRSRSKGLSESPCLLLGLPNDSGGGICRGAAHGPLALRRELYAHNSAWAKAELGDIPCIPQLVHDSMASADQLRDAGRALWGNTWRARKPVSPLSLFESAYAEAHDRFARPILAIGGDHSLSGAAFAALKRLGLTRRLAVLHLDAHTDLLDDRFGVRHCFGTWARHALDTLPDPARWVQVGLRTSRRTQSYWERNLGLRQIWAPEARRKDPSVLARELVKNWTASGCTGLYISIDVDAVDPTEIPSTGTPEMKGLTTAWASKLITECSKRMPLVGADIVELAPVLGSAQDARKSIRNAARLAGALRWT